MARASVALESLLQPRRMKRAPESKQGKATRKLVRSIKKARKEERAAATWAARARHGNQQVDISVNPLALTHFKRRPLFLVRGYYVDEPFTCRDCGRSEVWTSMQQKWWYEVAKAPAYKRAARCRACRQLHKKQVERSRGLRPPGSHSTKGGT